MVFEDLGLLFFTALLLSLLLTPATVILAQRIGAMDTPVDRSVHTRIMPRMGGLGMAFAICLALLFFVELDHVIVAFLLGMFVIVATGVADDLWQIRPMVKMAGQVVACLIFLLISDLQINSVGDLLGLGSIDFPELGIYVALFCMVGVINAFNLSDGLDGLAAGITVVIAVFLGVLALQSQHWDALFIIIVLLGGVLGFLKFNTYPAKMFMGDTGSLMLGYVMACLIVLLLDFQGTILIQPVTILLVFAAPVSDTLLVMTRRIAQGKSPVSPDKTHLHHRLLDLGFSHALVVIIMYAFTLYFCLLGIVLHGEPAWLQFFVGLGSCIVLYMLLWVTELSGIHVKESSLFQISSKEIISHLAPVAGKSLKWLRFTVLLGLAIPLFFLESSPVEAQGLLLGVLLLFLVAFPWREHHQHLNIVYALFYISGLSLLYVWNISEFKHFPLSWYTFGFVAVLSLWAMFKIRFKGHKEVFLTSGLEVLLIFVSWFVPYILLPVLHVSDDILVAAKTACFEAIPLFIVMKIVIRKQPNRNRFFAYGMLIIIFLAWFIAH